MMNIDSKTMLEAFEKTGGRGDVLSIPLEQCKIFADLPFERFAPICHQLFKWFVDGDETRLEDPLANAILEGLKEHQRGNALKRKAFLVRQAEKISRRWEKEKPRNTTEYRGIPRNTKYKNKEEVIVKDKQSESFTITDATVVVDGSGADADAAPEPPPPPTATATEAKRRIQDIAPEVNTDNYDQAAIKFYKANYVGVWSKNDRIAANRAAFVVGETCNMQTMQFLINSCRELGRELFLRAVFRMDQDVNKPSGSKIENPGAVLVTRLKQLKEAVAVVGR